MSTDVGTPADGGMVRAGRRTRRQDGEGLTPVRVFAISVSLVIHLAVALQLALLVWERPMASANDGTGEVPLAVMTDSELTARATEVELSADVPTEGIGGAMDDLPAVADLAPIADGELAALQQGDIAGLDSDAGGEGAGTGGADAGGAASFFGVEAYGSRFAFVVDISGSMTQGGRIQALENQLTSAVEGLLEHAHFCIVAFNSTAVPLTATRWVDASDRAKRTVNARVSRLSDQAAGGTTPDDAFRIVFDLRPRPDAIYFMTDGDFAGRNDAVANLVAELNARGLRQVPIHCITLIERRGEAVMRRIAAESDGTYTHVSGIVP